MGLFSKRRNKGFDPDLWTDASDRAKAGGDAAWFTDMGDDDPGLDELETNSGARFEDVDAEWLGDDPGEQVRRNRR